MIRSLTSRLGAVIGLGGLLALLTPAAARAQYSPDPYRPYYDMYDQYRIAQYPTGFDATAPNQLLVEQGPRSTGRGFQMYLESSDVFSDNDEPASASRRTLGVPYYRAYRQLDRSSNRIYTPNKEVDRSYELARQARDDKYAELEAATEPKERARLRKEYDELNRKVQRDLLQGGRGTTARKPLAAARPAATEPLPSTGSSARRTPRVTVPAVTPRTGTATGSATPAPRRPRPSATRTSPVEALRRGELTEEATPPERAAAPAVRP